MAPAPDAKALKALDALLETSTALLSQLQDLVARIHRDPQPSAPATAATAASPASSVANTTTEPSAPSPPNFDVLAVARDSASLIRAHSTKISLLIINEPFTPSAVAAVVREVLARPVPGLASAVQACEPRRYTRAFQRELAWHAHRVFWELKELLERVPRDGRVVAEDRRAGMGGPAGKGSITATGVLWSACDEVVKLCALGVGGYFVKTTEQWKDTLKDVMEELKEWGEEEPDEDEDDDGHDSVDELAGDMADSHLSAQAMLDNLMNSHQTIPASDPDRIRPRLDSSLKRLRLVILLYQALTKRRLKKLPPLPPPTPSTTTTDNTVPPPSNATAASPPPLSNVPHRLDEAAGVLRKLPDHFGDLACAFYELRPDEIDKAMDQCFFDAFAASEMLSQTWDGGRDEFTDWTAKFQTEIKKD